jgi:lipoprotein-releasing system permease protein
MYSALLAYRYLTSRVIPLVAVAAVGLCVALVIIVVSVMSGFLEEVRSSGRTLIGDVVISAPIDGIPAYERLLEELESDPMVAAACPVVDGWGLLRMPYPAAGAKDTQPVQFWGVDPERFARVTGYADALYWTAPRADAPWTETDFRRTLEDRFGDEGLAEVERQGLTLQSGTPGLAGVVLGLHISEFNLRQADGTVMPAAGGDWWMPNYTVQITSLPSAGGPSPEPVREQLAVVNEFRSGIFLIDDKRIILPLEIAQRLTMFDAAEEVDPVTGDATGRVDPARATVMLIRGAEGVSPEALRDRVSDLYAEWRPSIAADPTFAAGVRARPEDLGVLIQTWEQQQAGFIGPIEKERELMRTLFSMVYLVCAGLVLAIFWAIVYEKTRDIGILRAVGASRFGIAMIFVRYGLIIGILGAFVGLGLGLLVVSNINTIHDALGSPPKWLAVLFGAGALASLVSLVFSVRRGRLLPVVLGGLGLLVMGGLTAAVFLVNVTIWNAETYYFDRIPSRMDGFTAITTMLGAVAFSVLGAFFPAARAADTDPVRALRYE